MRQWRLVDLRCSIVACLPQGSLDTIPLGSLATLMPLLQMAGVLNDATIKSALKQVQRWGGVGTCDSNHFQPVSKLLACNATIKNALKQMRALGSASGRGKKLSLIVQMF